MRAVRKQRRGGNDGSFWLSFSDLMSCLVLIIILVMFYIIYQYFNEAEVNAKLIAAREAELDVMQTELTAAQSDLSAAQKELTSAQAELDAASVVLAEREDEVARQRTQLDTLSGQLDAKQTEIENQQTTLEEQKTQLETQALQLDAQQLKLTAQQRQLNDQQAQLESQQQQIEQLVGLRTRIVSSVSEAFRINHINAKVDPANGSIALESDVLFSSGDANITDSGKYFLDKVLPVYLEVLFSEEYRPYVTEIIIEGHTDSDGTWLRNLKLSQERAYAMAEYVLGSECRSISPDLKNELREIVTVNGRSYSERIFDDNGVEDKDASRRVVFKFRLTDEQMIAQLQKLLENEGVN